MCPNATSFRCKRPTSQRKLDKRYLLLPIEQAKTLLEQMNQTTKLQMKIGEVNYQGVRFSDNEPSLEFEVTKKKRPIN